jgi:hypothetical protein
MPTTFAYSLMSFLNLVRTSDRDRVAQSPRNLIALIDRADKHGVLRVKSSKFFDAFHGRKPPKELLRELTLEVFEFAPWAVANVRHGAEWLADGLASATWAKDGTWEGTFQLDKMLLLPGISPAEELAELGQLLAAISVLMSSQPSQSCELHFSASRRNLTVPPAPMTFCVTRGFVQTIDATVTMRLQAHVDRSPALTHFVTKLRAVLEKTEPRAGWGCDEYALFAEGERPHAKFVAESMLRRRSRKPIIDYPDRLVAKRGAAAAKRQPSGEMAEA